MFRPIGMAFALGCLAASGLAQSTATQYSITAAAGSLPVSGDGGPATAAVLRDPRFIKLDAAGNLYFCEGKGYRIRKVATDGTITTIAGNGVIAGSPDGAQAASSPIDGALGIAFDSTGNLYFSELGIRRITAAGVLATVVGGSGGYGGDGGPATLAMVSNPSGLTFDTAGNLYIADSANNRVRKVDTNGIITTVAGNGTAGFAGDGGPANAAELNDPWDVAVDSNSNLYIADSNNNRVRVVTPAGIISTYAGTGAGASNGDGGSATNAAIHGPDGLTIDAAGRLYVSDSMGYRVRRITPTPTGTVIETVAGNGTDGSQGDGGPALAAVISEPVGLALDAAGNLYIADTGVDQRIRMVTPGGIITTVAGVTHFGGDGGPAVTAQLNFPESVAADSSGNLYIADTQNHRVRKVTPDGNIITIAGTGVAGYSGDGKAAASAALHLPGAVAVDASGNLYIADTSNHRVRMVNSSGTISTIAGNGNSGYLGDGGPAISAELNKPIALALDSAGDLYIADQNDNVVRMVNPQGTITTVAGTGTTGFSGDGGPATLAQFNEPDAIAVDSAGNLYIADEENFRVRRVDGNGNITTIVGTGKNTSNGDGGLATAASVRQVTGLAVDTAGNLFLADPLGGEIRRVNPSGVITTVAGNGIRSSTGDGGMALSATLGGTEDAGYQLAIGPGGMIYFADYLNEEIRRLTPNVPAKVVIVSAQANPFVIEVEDASGVGVPGVPVNFQFFWFFLSGSGTVTTDSNGRASMDVTLLPGAPVTVYVQAAGLSAGTTVGPAPAFSVNAVVGAGLSVPAVTQISSNGLASIFGVNFAPAGTFRAIVSNDIVNGQLPTNLNGVCVAVNGQRAAMLLVTPTQLNIQIPSIPQSGTVPVQVVLNCDQAGEIGSVPVTAIVQAATPEFFFLANNSNGQNPVAATPATPHPGDIVTIYMTGLGPTYPNYAPGVLPTAAAQVTGAVTVTLGTESAPALYAGVTPGNAGLYQLNLQIPDDAPAGNIPLTVTVAGFSTPPGGYLTIGN